MRPILMNPCPQSRAGQPFPPNLGRFEEAVSSLARAAWRWLASRIPRIFSFSRDDSEMPGGPAGTGPASGPESGVAADLDLRMVRDRDPQAMETFFDTHFPRVYSLVRRLTRQETEAEDLAQEVFYRVYQALDRLDPERDPVPWLMTISYNVCRDYWRSRSYRSSRRTYSLEDETGAAQTLAAPGRAPDEEREADERAKLVQRGLLRLSEQARAVVLMRDYQGMEHAQIAAAVGISEAAARKRYSRALKDLGEHIKEMQL